MHYHYITSFLLSMTTLLPVLGAAIWWGIEDIDFSANAGTGNFRQAVADTTASSYRSTYARCNIHAPGGGPIGPGFTAQSFPFPGGALTSAWLSFEHCRTGPGNDAEHRKIGFGLSGTQKGLFLGTGNTDNGKWGLWKYDGTTETHLGSDESGFNIAALHRYDVQIINYGATATVNVYMDLAANPIISFTGDVTVTGMTNFDCVSLGMQAGNSAPALSEIFVTTDDSRAYAGVAQMSGTADGTTHAWNGVYSDINQVTASDATPNNTNTAGLNQQGAMTTMPSGTFLIAGVKTTIRAAVGVTPAVSEVKLGYKSGGVIAFGTGAGKFPGGAFASFEQFDLTNNPCTGAPWLQTELNAPLDYNMQSA